MGGVFILRLVLCIVFFHMRAPFVFLERMINYVSHIDHEVVGKTCVTFDLDQFFYFFIESI